MKVGTAHLTCALGGTGTTNAKKEGDKATPTGRMRFVSGFYRPDVMSRPFCRIPLHPMTHDLVWCDDPGSPLYNRSRRLPLRAGHERMWREDGLYDLVFVLDYNLRPRRAGKGSAIFFHCAKRELQPTLGCVALRPADMRRLVPRLAKDARILVR